MGKTPMVIIEKRENESWRRVYINKEAIQLGK